MKKVLLSIAAIAFIAMPSLAQEKVIKKTKFSDNWFIQAQGGASYTISENFKDASVGDLITPTVAVSFGKHFTPVFGLRAQASGWESKSQYTHIDDTYRHKYIQAGLDGMFNLTNVFGEYDKDRFFNFYGMVGLAYVHGWSKDKVNLNAGGPTPDHVGILKSNMIIPRVGFHADMRLADALSLNLEVTGNLLEDRFNGVERAKAYDGMITALAGLTFHINKGFEVTDYIDPAELDALNNRINEQRALMNAKDNRISALENELAQKPKVVVEEVEVEPIEEIVMNAVVVFKLGKSDLQDNQEINIFNAAKFFQENPNKHCIITGYADKATGNPTINQKLSERRAEAVAKIMIEKFGISPSRITTQAGGDRVQPFAKDEWNRVVIFTAVNQK